MLRHLILIKLALYVFNIFYKEINKLFNLNKITVFIIYTNFIKYSILHIISIFISKF